MNHTRRRVVPPLVTGVFLFAYLLTYSIDAYGMLLGASLPGEIGRIRVLFLGMGSLLYAGYRVARFHPYFDTGYCRWLCLTPWSVDKPLPLGPVHLVWGDLVILMVLILLAYFNTPFAPSLVMVPVIVFLSVYLIILWLTLAAQQLRIMVVSLFLAPFAVYPFRSAYAAVLVLLVLYVLCYVAFRRFFRDFPWNTQY